MFRSMDKYCLRGGDSVKIVWFTSEKGSTLIGKNLFPRGAIFSF